MLCQSHVDALPTRAEEQDTATEPAGPVLGEFPSSPAFSAAQEFRTGWKMGLPPSEVSSPPFPLPAPLVAVPKPCCPHEVPWQCLL